MTGPANTGNARRSLVRLEKLRSFDTEHHGTPCVAIGGKDGRACVVKTLVYNREVIGCLAVNGKGTYLVAGDDGGQVRCVRQWRVHALSMTT